MKREEGQEGALGNGMGSTGKNERCRRARVCRGTGEGAVKVGGLELTGVEMGRAGAQLPGKAPWPAGLIPSSLEWKMGWTELPLSLVSMESKVEKAPFSEPEPRVGRAFSPSDSQQKACQGGLGLWTRP